MGVATEPTRVCLEGMESRPVNDLRLISRDVVQEEVVRLTS